VVFANASWERLCGWQASEVTGRSGLAFIQGPDTDPVTVQHINAAVKNGEVRLSGWRCCWAAVSV
jgi:PAS domain-containing protein